MGATFSRTPWESILDFKPVRQSVAFSRQTLYVYVYYALLLLILSRFSFGSQLLQLEKSKPPQTY